MILRKPDFYDKFKCTASRCSDTCCVGWEIDIDKDSLDAYRKVAGVFGDKLRANIEDGHFKLQPHDRCPFLDKETFAKFIRISARTPFAISAPSIRDLWRSSAI